MRTFFVIFPILFLATILPAQQPDTSCVTAGVFCDRESLEGIWTLPPIFAPEFPDRICNVTDGQPNNPLYFGFVPNSTTVSFQFNPIICSPGSSGQLGFQWAILEGCDLEDPTYVICDGDQLTGLVTVSYDQFVPGTTYYLILDGWEGSICDIAIDVISGIAPAGLGFTADDPTHFTTSLGDLILPGDTLDFCYEGEFTMTVHGADNNNGFFWSSPQALSTDIIHPSQSDSLRLIFDEKDSLYQVCVYATTDCDDSETICFFVNVQAEPNDTLGLYEYCSADLAQGVDPPGWEGNVLYNEGTYFHTVVDAVTSCTHLQMVTLKENTISIESKDTLFCGLDTLFYNGDTITGDYFEKQYRFNGSSQNGCDSLLFFRAQRVRFYAAISDLACLNSNEFGLRVEIDSIIPANYDDLIVDWFRDGIHIHTGLPNDLELVVDTKGKYSALVSVMVNGEICQFDLDEVDIDRFITAGFSTSSDAICVSDTLTVTLDAFNIAASYSWLSGDQVIQVFPGQYQIIWNTPGTYNLGLLVDYQNCEVNSPVTKIEVEPLLEAPVIQCGASTDHSLSINWAPVDCASFYEIYLDGNLVAMTDDLKFSFTGLDEATDYLIEITALSECLCPSVTGSNTCSTSACPDDIVLSIEPLPMKLCLNEWTEDMQLTGQVSGTQGGSLSWDGDIVESDGSILTSNLSAGIHEVTLSYVYNFCQYEITDTLEIFEPAAIELSHSDISCFYNTDGLASIDPVQGTAPFDLFVNGAWQANMELTGLDEGHFIVRLVDANGCETIDSFDVFRPEKPDIHINGMTLIERGDVYDYELSINNIEYDSVVWYIPSLDTILCAGACDIVSYAPLFDQELCLEIFYDSVCSIDTCIQLRVTQDTHVFIPNIFTPGKRDGLNDYFMVKTNSYDGVLVKNLSIFDRWGEAVFQLSDQWISSRSDDTAGWNGEFKGKSAMSGVYIYYMEIEDRDGQLLRFSGDITLIR